MGNLADDSELASWPPAHSKGRVPAARPGAESRHSVTRTTSDRHGDHSQAQYRVTSVVMTSPSVTAAGTGTVTGPEHIHPAQAPLSGAGGPSEPQAGIRLPPGKFSESRPGHCGCQTEKYMIP